MKSGPDYGKAHNKSIYLFSLDRTAGKVAHVNYVPQELVKSKKIDAKVWLEQANKVLGGKVSPARALRSERWRARGRPDGTELALGFDLLIGRWETRFGHGIWERR